MCCQLYLAWPPTRFDSRQQTGEKVPKPMSNHGRAIVVGGSVSGLLAARALSESFERVAIIERDELSAGAQRRRGVPQGKQSHVILPLGLRLIAELFPGIDRELQDEGCPLLDEVRDIAEITSEGWHVRTQSNVPFVGFTRPLFEWVIRRRANAIPNIDIRQGQVVGLATDAERGRVTGVRLKGEPDVLMADLVVDASGRGSKSARWLKEIGYDPPDEQHVLSYMGYAGQLVRVPDGVLPEGLHGLIALPFPPRQLRGGIFLPAENGTHLLTAIGMMRDYPPRDLDSVLEFLRDAPTPLLCEILARCEPVGELATYHMPGNQRRLWEDLNRRPTGFVVIGDAVASFNPIYGQGIAVSAVAAMTLRHELAQLGGDLSELPAQFQEALRPKTDLAFGLAAGTDALYDGAELVNTPPPLDEDVDYFIHLEQLATEDPVVAAAINHSYGWMDPDALYADEIKTRVADWVTQGRRVRNNDPLRLPELVSRQASPAMHANVAAQGVAGCAAG